MHPALQGFLIGAGLALVLIIFEYSAINREIAEKSKRMAKKIDWDSNQIARMRGMVTFGVGLPIGMALIAWMMFG